MSVLGIAAGSIFQYLNSSSAQSNYQNFQKEFQQLGQDLSSGNLAAAQSAYTTLQQDFQQLGSSAPASSTASSPVNVSA